MPDMSSPVGTMGPVPTASKAVNAKKRVLTDIEDGEERDLKKVRQQELSGDQSNRRDTKEKKKRRKKKRKLPVVQAQDLSEVEGPAVVLKLPTPRVRSRSPATAGLAAVTEATGVKVLQCDTRQPSAGPSSRPVAQTTSSSQNENGGMQGATITTTVDKGKRRATPDAAVAPDNQEEVSELEKQVSDKTNLISRHQDLVSALQQSLSCQICLDLMHRPYALSPCGHSACYQCLVNWFKAPPPDVPANEVLPPWLRKKTCPHCRTVIKDRPIEIWAIKDMVATLVKSGLATGFYNPSPVPAEGPANADPWAGIFRPFRGDHQNVFPDHPYPAPLHQLMGLRDDEDGGIYRCIDCHHEIWDGVCSECGRVYPGHDPEHDLDEFDDEEDVRVQEALWRDGLHPGWGDDTDDDYMDEPFDHLLFLRHLGNAFRAANPPPLDYDDIWDAGGDTEIESDGEGEDVHSGDEGRPRNRRRDDDESGEGYESSFIDDGDDAGPARRTGSNENRRGPQGDVINLTDEDDEYQDEARLLRRSRLSVPARGRGPIVISSDEEDLEHNEDEIFSDYGHSEDDDNLANDVAARELELYGDDGSVPRGGGRHYDVYDYDSEDYSY